MRQSVSFAFMELAVIVSRLKMVMSATRTRPHEWPRLYELCSSENFWRGFATGFSAQRYLFTRFRLDDSVTESTASDSILEAWQSVGWHLTEAIKEVEIHGNGNKEPTDRTPDKNLDTALKEKLEEAISSVIGQGQRAQVVERVTQVVAAEIFT